MYSLASLAVACCVLATLGLSDSAVGATTERVSVSSSGAQGDRYSYEPSVSSDGSFVAFASDASTMIEGDGNGVGDVFVRDRTNGTTERVSVSSGGEEGDDQSFGTSISADGRFVAFESQASNMVAGDGNGVGDVFVHDRILGTTERVSLSSSEAEGNSASTASAISPDGRFVVFQSTASNLVPGDTNGTRDIFVRDRAEGATERVSVSSGEDQGNRASGQPIASADGRFVAFSSHASNLVPGDTNAAGDIFVHDRELGTTERVSVSSGEDQGNKSSAEPSISADGRFVSFQTVASNLVAGDTNGKSDVFVRDRELGATERVSVGSGGTQSNGKSYQGDQSSISADGRLVTFASSGSNMIAGDTNKVRDVFLHDRSGDQTIRVSLKSNGGQANLSSFLPVISADGAFVVFDSVATNLVTGDTNGRQDVFLRGPLFFEAEQAPAEQCQGEDATITGTGTITGTAGDDVIVGSAEPDQIDGGDGNDLICAGDGDDEANGEGGDDEILGEDGSDDVRGAAGSDLLRGQAGEDILRANFGNDLLKGNVGDDDLRGGLGDDEHRGGQGFDTCSDAGGSNVFRSCEA